MGHQHTMRGGQLLYDGMWRCLCPALDRNALSRAINAPILTENANRRPSTRRATRCLASSYESARCRRSYGTDAAVLGDHSSVITRELRQETRSAQQPAQPVQWDHKLLAPRPPTKETLHEAPTELIFTGLKRLRNLGGPNAPSLQDMDRSERIQQFVRHLIEDRHQELSPFIYECMMDSMAHPKGSAEGVRKLLQEIQYHGLGLTASLCRIALEALAVHPNYVLRQHVLAKMREYWFNLDGRARQSVVLGMLRDGQYELAYERLIEMVDGERLHLDLWVYDIFILVFGKLGFLDEVLALLHRRRAVDKDDAVAESLVYYALDVCSQGFHYEGTSFAWNIVRSTSVVPPPDGITENVLGTAARHGDATLATEALNLLASRSRVRPYHYEAVAEAFAHDGNIPGSLRILCIMERNGAMVEKRNTRDMLELLRREPHLVGKAEQSLESLRKDYDVPYAAVAVVIEAKAALEGAGACVDLYRDVEALCGQRPDANMIQNLILACEQGTFLGDLIRDYNETIPEEEDAGRSYTTYDNLIMKCLDAGGDLGLAFRLAPHGLSKANQPARTPKWVKRLVQAAIAEEDRRVWAFMDTLEESGEKKSRNLVRFLLDVSKGTGSEAAGDAKS